MNNSKLILLLNTFSPQEIHRFRLYLQSPYHNANPLFYELYEAIRPYLHSRNKNEINALLVWKQINPTVKFNTIQFNKHCSNLYQLAANFIALNSIETKSNTIPLQFLKVLNQRKLTALFPFHATKAKQEIEKVNQKTNQFFDNFLWQQEFNNYQEVLQSRTKPRNTAEVLTALDNFYLHQKLKYWSVALHYQKMFDQPISILWDDFLFDYLQQNQQADETIEINRQILLLEKLDDATLHYKWLKEKLMNKKSKLLFTTQKEIYLFLINYCIAQINSGESKYYKEIFEIYKLGLRLDLIIQQKIISPWDFKNIITVALQQKEINWAENFIVKYNSNLPKDEIENAYNYNLAKVFFIQKKYTESLKLLNQVAYTDIFYQLDIKILQAKTLFELNESDTLDDLMVSFTKLLNRKRKLSNHYQKRYKRFINYLQKILKVESEAKINTLILQLENDNEVPDRNWLLEKIKSKK
ncbi:MAG: hypothetical protein RIQ33_283, partial [Bacteroidota bacterium]